MTTGPDPQKALASDDPLGYDAYARTLWERIEQALNKDQGSKTLGDDPLVIGIFGEWGAGKSYLLNKVHDHVRGHQKRRAEWRELDGGSFGLTIPVVFQPWKYEHEEHLHVPMLLHVLSALKQGLKEAQTPGEGVWQAMQQPGDAIVSVLPKVVELVEKLVQGTVAAVDPVAATTLGVAKAVVSKSNWFGKPKIEVAADLKYRDDGRYFYDVHRVLKAVTRPKQHDGYLQGVVINTPIAINFVVLVDDLDRCLPEKAVAVLELIKTVFNVESFAFVLALDDEVIERGIGHRYREYALGNKKPEMPITGFEYLEKIVHLPFRLPALTRDDALRFMEMKEAELLRERKPGQGSPQAWFGSVMPAQRHGAGRMGGDITLRSKSEVPVDGDGDSTMGASAPLNLHLSHLVVNAFDAYVPRKLVRVVELFHQVARVAEARGRPLGAVLGGPVDARLVLALVLLQLFQPELYRCLKRTGTGFDVVRRSFANGEISAEFSDHDLMAWACYATLDHAAKGYAKKAPKADAATDDKSPPVTLAATLERIARLSDDKRHPAQRIRLPVAERLLEHRAAQRHVFDPLKLFAALNASGELAPLSDTTRIQSYYSLLALAPPGSDDAVLGVVSQAALAQDAAPSTLSVLPATRRPAKEATALSDVRGVYNALISAEASEQDDVANRTGLGVGQVIATRSASELKTLVARWLTESSADSDQRQRQLLRGLLALGPLLDDAMAKKEFWELVKGCVKLPQEPGEQAQDPLLCALYADVRGVLRQDDRFEPATPWLLKDRFTGHTEQDEPLPGFVRIPAGEFIMGHADESDNPPRTVRIAEPFYIARTQTTVDQYAHFVEAGGYAAGADLWGTQGLAWRRGEFDLAESDKDLKAWLARRSGKLRLAPWDWEAQRPHGSRPVWGISWFEARAYARWLDGQLRGQLQATAGLHSYRVMLPTELQWERAARAQTLAAAHTDPWPWDHDGKGVEAAAAKLANIEPSGVGRACSVGALAPNAIGLYDMAGNVWEWQDNLYATGPDGFERIARERVLARHEEWAKADCPAVRGGSWILRPEHARCSYRIWIPPGNWANNLGFRVVLSLAEMTTEN